MGTINYMTSEIITLGFYNDYDCDDYDVEMEFQYDEIKRLIENYQEKQGYYYHVTIEYGYYEGFSVNIERNYPVCFDYSNDKTYAQKELTQLKKLLHDCIDNGLYVCYPGWGTSWTKDWKECYRKIDEAIKEEREFVRNTPTYWYYEKNLPCRKSA